MHARLRKLIWARPGEFLAGADEMTRVTANVLYALCITVIAWCVVYLLVFLPLFAARKLAGAAIVATVLTACLIALRLLRSGRIRAASWVGLGTAWIAATLLVALNGGIRSLGVVLFLPLIVGAACLLGERVAWCGVALYLAMTLAFAVSEELGAPPPSYFPGRPMAMWGILLLAGALLTAPLIRVITALENTLMLMRKRADELAQLDRALHESEERLRAIVEAAPDAIFIVNRDGRVMEVNEAATKQLGYDREKLLRLKVLDFVGPEFHERVKGRFPNFDGLIFYESRHVRSDGTSVPVELNTRKIVYGGEPAMLGIARDITDRKMAEGQLRAANHALASELRERTRSEHEVRALSARLINAQEAERARIARELHDNFSQQIAVLSIATSNLKLRLPPELGEAVAQSGRIQQTLASLAEGVRRLSHELHPAVLQYSGLTAALGNYCAEFAALSAHRITFRAEGDCDDAPPEIALCIFRVAQEALQNSIKHARVDEAEVLLKRDGDALRLTVSDCGAGMDPDAAAGLGLVSIRERTRLVSGILEIKTQPGEGVTITLTVPLAAPDSGREAASAYAG